jgi:uncharacterized RDD family membrane protein YckC
MKIRLIRTNGERVGWSRAFLRSFADVIFYNALTAASFIAVWNTTTADYQIPAARDKSLSAHQPAWLRPIDLLSGAWTWSEVIVMLCNKRRRSLHDFIAGTVVISEKKTSAPETSPVVTAESTGS